MLAKRIHRLGARYFSTQFTCSVNPDDIIGKTYEQYSVDLPSKDMILYALSINFSQDPLNRDHFKFTNEAHKNFTAFPTQSVAMALQRFPSFLKLKGFPAVDPYKILHGAEELQILKPLEEG